MIVRKLFKLEGGSWFDEKHPILKSFKTLRTLLLQGF